MIKVYFFARYREGLKTAEETFSEQIYQIQKHC